MYVPRTSTCSIAGAFSYRRSEVDGCAATDMDSDLGQGRARGTNVGEYTVGDSLWGRALQIVPYY